LVNPGHLELKLQQFRQTLQRAEAAAKRFRAEQNMPTSSFETLKKGGFGTEGAAL
jgi:hypothetical protein